MELLRGVCESTSEKAFEQLVARHLTWLSMRCDQVRDPIGGGNSPGASIIMARKAGTLPPGNHVSAAFSKTVRYAATASYGARNRRWAG